VRYHVVPLELAEANALVAQWHRHHQPDQGHRFSVGAVDADGVLHGGAIVGRPRARMAGSPRDVLEVTRLVTDGTENCCSLLYAAAARAGAAMGYRRIQTYVLNTESGTSLRAAGWTDEGEAGGGQWKHTDGRPRRTDQPTEMKRRWAKTLTARPDLAAPPRRLQDDDADTLFD
jgi:opacity protein-like surface antigen